MKKDTIGSTTPNVDRTEWAAALRQTMDMLSSRWTIEILHHLFHATLRFGALRRALPGITQHMLSARLKSLEAEGLIERVAFPEVPPRVEYSLTPRGRRLQSAYRELMRWSVETYILKRE